MIAKIRAVVRDLRSHNFAVHLGPVASNETPTEAEHNGQERALLKDALERSGMSARQAALKMDISDTRLRHIINGYQPVGRGHRIPVIAPEDTLARISMVLGVTPDQLAQAGREDAAYELRKRQQELSRWGDDSAAVVEAIAEWAEDPVNYLPPDDALRFFTDSSLLGEIDRRLGRLRALNEESDRRGHVDHSWSVLEEVGSSAATLKAPHHGTAQAGGGDVTSQYELAANEEFRSGARRARTPVVVGGLCWGQSPGSGSRHGGAGRRRTGEPLRP